MTGAPGKFVLMRNGGIVERFDSWREALDAGYKRFGLAPFLVQETGAPPLEFSRDHCFSDETTHLLRSPTNAARLRQSIADADAGKLAERDASEPKALIKRGPRPRRDIMRTRRTGDAGIRQ
jgi:hypothetical protein